MDKYKETEKLIDIPGQDVWVRARLVKKGTSPNVSKWDMLIFYNPDGEDAGELYYPAPSDLQIKD